MASAWRKKLSGLSETVRNRSSDRRRSWRTEALPAPLRWFGASVPVLAFFIVVFQVFSAGDEQTILQTTGVKSVADWRWDVSQYDLAADRSHQCAVERCFDAEKVARSKNSLELPKLDPLGTGTWPRGPGFLTRYATTIPRAELQGLREPLLYVPGVQAERVLFFVDGRMLANSTGGLPFFISLENAASLGKKRDFVEVEALLLTKEGRFQGFIRKELFIGTRLSVYRAHHRLTSRSFPRNAVVIFLLSLGALTFAFFVFLDHKRELFALGLATSTLGVAQAVRVGILPFFGTEVFFVLFSLHVILLFWYATELVRVPPKPMKGVVLPWVAVLVLWAGSSLAGEYTGALQTGLLQVLNFTVILAGVVTAAGAWWTLHANRERAIQIGVAALAFFIYGIYLFAGDWERVLGVNIGQLYEIPVMACEALWIISGLASLGTLERRVSIALKDQERRQQLEAELQLAEEVQQSFIGAGEQESSHYEVRTLYKAAKNVGGDWVCWRDVPGGYGLGIIGDVVGKGIQAGLIVSACDATLQLLMRKIDPVSWGIEETLKEIAEALHSAVIARHPKRALTATILLCREDGEIAYVSFGHPPILGISAEGVRLLTVRNTWLGLTFEPDRIRYGTLTLRPGETLLGFTDGICDGSKELRRFRDRWLGWHDRPLADFAAEFEGMIPDYDDQSVLLIRHLASGGSEKKVS